MVEQSFWPNFRDAILPRLDQGDDPSLWEVVANTVYADAAALARAIVEVESASEKKSLRFHVPDGALARPPLKELGDNAAMLLAQPAIAKYVQVARPMPEAKVETILSLGTASEAEPTKVTTAGPAVLAWHPTLGGDKPAAGRVVLVTTTADAQWNNRQVSVS